MNETVPDRGDAFAEAYRLGNHAELILVRMFLDRMRVRYYIKNELATLGALSSIGCEEMTVMMESDRAKECREAIRAAIA